MGKFKKYINEEYEYHEYIKTIDMLIEHIENNTLDESVLDNISKKFKKGIDFIKTLSIKIGIDFIDLLKIFKDKILFTFFNKIKWSVEKLIKIVKKGFKAYRELRKVIVNYIKDTKVVEWTREELLKLDEYLKKHPIIKKIGGIVVAGLLIYIWTQMISFTGDIDFDFDQSALFNALAGAYSLAELFASENGIEMLMFVATNTLAGISFPWPSDTWVLFTLSILYTLTKQKYPVLASKIARAAKTIRHL